MSSVKGKGGRRHDSPESKIRRGTMKPEDAVIVEMPVQVPEVPVPDRALGPNGQQVWERLWRTAPWLLESDSQAALTLAELEDERTLHRTRVLRDPEKNWRSSVAARQIERQQLALIVQMGLTPAARAAMDMLVSSAARNVATIQERRSTGQRKRRIGAPGQELV
jgi:hypothetical protein